MRYTRQDLKQDKFAETASEAIYWTVEHRSKLIAAAVAAAVVVVLAAGVFWYRSYSNDKASTELGNAMVLYNAPVQPADAPKEAGITTFASTQERDIAAKNAFYAVSSKYGFTPSGQYAHYLAAMCEVELENYKVAEDQLKQVADVHNSEVVSLARFALASVYRDTNRDNDAIDLYKKLAEKPTTSLPKATAQLELAAVYATKDSGAARGIYDQVVKENPNTAASEIAQARKAELK